MAKCNQHPGLLPDGHGTGTGLDIRVTKRKVFRNYQLWPPAGCRGVVFTGSCCWESSFSFRSWNEEQLGQRDEPLPYPPSCCSQRSLPDPQHTWEVGRTQPVCRGAHVSWPHAGAALSSWSHTANPHWPSALHRAMMHVSMLPLQLSRPLLPPPCPKVCSQCLCLHCSSANRFSSISNGS